MGGEGKIISCDLHPHKRKLIANGAQRMELSLITPMTINAKEYRSEWEKAFPRVLVDAPCSGLGVIRKKPEIRYKDPQPLQELPRIQREILDNTCRYVQDSGVLLYSTCTILDRENGQVVMNFLSDHPDFSLEAFSLPSPIGRVEQGMITLLPHIHGTDGFFIAKLRRRT